MSSPFSYIDLQQSEISKLPKSIQDSLYYTCALAVLIDVSILEAKDIGENKIFKTATQHKFEVVAKQINKLQKSSSLTETLVLSILATAVAIPLSALITEIAIVGISAFRIAKGKKKSFIKEFHTEKLKRLGKPVPTAFEVGEVPLENWKRNVLTKLKKEGQDRKSVERLKTAVDPTIGSAIDFLLKGDASKKNKKSNKKEVMSPDDFWQYLESFSNAIQDSITQFIQNSKELRELGIPLLEEEVHSIKQKTERPFRNLKWLSEELEPLKKGEISLSSPGLRNNLTAIAQNKLSSIWLLEFISIHAPLYGVVNGKYYANTGLLSKRPFVGKKIGRQTFQFPYKVRGFFFQ
ncbi:MAG: hypothetical protein COB15_14050 [Flavobacteriales bacterium]|nr:MAG: hypothetical protein COB15_14050 [Flavobacteriales bacterium]